VIKRIDKNRGLEAYLQLVDGGYFYGKDLPLLHLNVDFLTEVHGMPPSSHRASKVSLTGSTLSFFLFRRSFA
jgi:hypothetical protein